jgi:hypothetical protein
VATRVCRLWLWDRRIPADLRSVFADPIIPYAKAWNLKYGNLIQARLPREIRDIVYAFLWAVTLPYTDDQLRNIVRGERRSDQTDLMHLYDYHGLSHFLSPHYVGRETACEVAEALYKTTNVLGRIVWSSSRLKRAILYDSFRVGFIPSTVLQHIHIDCKLDNYRTRRTCDGTRSNWRCKHTAAETKFLRGVELAAKFDTLNHIKNKGSFHLHVVLLQRNVRLAILAEAMDALRNVRDVFMKAGADVNIIWNYSGP